MVRETFRMRSWAQGASGLRFLSLFKGPSKDSQYRFVFVAPHLFFVSDQGGKAQHPDFEVTAKPHFVGFAY